MGSYEEFIQVLCSNINEQGLAQIFEPCKSKDLIQLLSWITQQYAVTRISHVKLIENCDKNTFWCYHCFKSGTRKSLFRCIRCKGAFYCNTECQKNNWKFHKHSCGPVSPSVENMNPRQCLCFLGGSLYGAFSNPWQRRGVVPSADLPAVLFRTRRYLIEECQDMFRNSILSDYDVSCQDFAEALHTMCRPSIQSEEEYSKFFLRYWACPGMVELILRSPLVAPEILEIETTRRVPNPLVPVEVALDLDWTSLPSYSHVYPWGFFVCNMMGKVLTCDLRPKMSHTWDFSTDFQKDLPCFDTVLDRLAELYVQRQVHQSIHDPFDPVSNVMSQMCLDDDRRRKFQAKGLIESALFHLEQSDHKRGAGQVLMEVVEEDLELLSDEILANLLFAAFKYLKDYTFYKGDSKDQYVYGNAGIFFGRLVMSYLLKSDRFSEVIGLIVASPVVVHCRSKWHYTRKKCARPTEPVCIVTDPMHLSSKTKSAHEFFELLEHFDERKDKFLSQFELTVSVEEVKLEAFDSICTLWGYATSKGDEDENNGSDTD